MVRRPEPVQVLQRPGERGGSESDWIFCLAHMMIPTRHRKSRAEDQARFWRWVNRQRIRFAIWLGTPSGQNALRAFNTAGMQYLESGGGYGTMVMFRVPSAASCEALPPQIGAYGKLKTRLQGTDLQANHLNQTATFKGIIPHEEGIALGMRGNAFTDVGSEHHAFHLSLEVFWNRSRRGGSKSGQVPTNGDYGKALKAALENLDCHSNGRRKSRNRLAISGPSMDFEHLIRYPVFQLGLTNEDKETPSMHQRTIATLHQLAQRSPGSRRSEPRWNTALVLSSWDEAIESSKIQSGRDSI